MNYSIWSFKHCVYKMLLDASGRRETLECNACLQSLDI